ncbi:hypothetical protein [Thermosediminibacter oceani]|uniref:Glycosyltransferase n=1 Tax=Thermosediminibacter oceani (strain ATCC BAA-1034 / DSM 16646 / JW/IW-1228P) TaxID=555079 RepID=D9RYK9_THEOJ|nr:hypothetical protein [Thermosediminibacter oceani]ADL08433.1 conserved hypothetical protein [Thermosediminibacter oceani DSM 16646]
MYKHLLRMTDSTGIIQFSDKSRPLKSSGYTVDDNARALLVAINMKDKEREKLSRIYASFLEQAQEESGIWNNLKLEDRFVPVLNSEDCIGRAFMAASFAANSDLEDIKLASQKMILKSMKKALNVQSPRAVAYVLLGLVYLINNFNFYSALYPAAKDMANRLVKLYEECHTNSWQWFEEKLTYCNALLPHSLFAFYAISNDKKVLEVARNTLRFLTDALFKRGYLNIVGNRGWWQKESEMPLYDQQPVDAASVILACLQAFLSTGEKEYVLKAKVAYDWYWGKNINEIPLINRETQGCHDALTPHGVNQNQGAEALISFLLAHQILKGIENREEMVSIPAV